MHQDPGIFCGRNQMMNSYLLLMLMAFTGTLIPQSLKKGVPVNPGTPLLLTFYLK